MHCTVAYTSNTLKLNGVNNLQYTAILMVVVMLTVICIVRLAKIKVWRVQKYDSKHTFVYLQLLLENHICIYMLKKYSLCYLWNIMHYS